MTESIFTTPNDETATPKVSYVEALVGPGKKYKDIETLAKSVVDKDVFIETLKTESKQVREELNKRLTLEDFLDKTAPKEQPNSSASKQVHNHEPVEREEIREPAPRSASENIRPEQLQTMIKEIINAENTKSTRATNIDTVRMELEKTWGSNYVAQLQTKAKDLGVPTDFLDDMAARAPKAFLALVGVEESSKDRVDTSVINPPVGGKQTTFVENVSDHTNGIKNSAYYDRLRQTNPKEYFSSRVQVERHTNALKLGDKFFVS